MPKAFDKWMVLPHGKIEKLEENLWRVDGTLPGGGPPRVMTIARLRDGRLVIHGAIALDDASMKELEALGRQTVHRPARGCDQTRSCRFPLATIHTTPNAIITESPMRL